MSLECPRVAVVVLDWNGLEAALKCLQSIQKIDDANFEIGVVDNESIDGRARYFRG